MSDLDPKDWDAFRRTAHALLDACVDRLAQAGDHPWIPVPEDTKSGYALSDTPSGLEAAATRMAKEVMPYGVGNTHPRFFGWVHGTGLASGLLSEMVAATMNANCGGRDHAAVYLERAVIDWTRDVMGFPDTASGVLVSGTSQATVIAMSAARLRALGAHVRAKGNSTRLTAYAGAGVHNAARKAVELLGIGADNLRKVDDWSQVPNMIAADRAAGGTPFMLIGTAGSVDFGTFDDFHALADLAASENLWLHIDGAFGAWLKLADTPWRELSNGLERADSLACDFHKWMYVPYDCGLCLIRDETEHRAAFAARPSYLAPQKEGVAGGDPWYCDYGIDLSRGNRALKVWAAIESYGGAGLGAAISDNCARAAQMGALIKASDKMALAAPVVSNLVVFTADQTLPPEAQSELNAGIAQKLQLSGDAVFSTTLADGITCLRAAITNHRTTAKDIEIAIAAVDRETP
ncbi:MAG: pyridoxal-dependent decarboxylase [Marinovum sp.]|nr:pyridoxal-dependent decarboxylase [Marinovum sp.]